MRTAITTVAFLLAISIIYAAAAAKGQTVRMSAADCTSLTTHVPDSDVAYKPGVDVNGNSVAPADVGGGLRIETPTEFEIPITLDLQKKLNIPADENLFQTDHFRAGTVTVKGGRAYFNGQPLQDEEAARLSELCQKRLRAGR
jgi:hypothetical protein